MTASVIVGYIRTFCQSWQLIVQEWMLKCVRVQPTTCSFLDADGLAPLKLLQLALLLFICHSGASINLQRVFSGACV
jgi:hypothetical protein